MVKVHEIKEIGNGKVSARIETPRGWDWYDFDSRQQLEKAVADLSEVYRMRGEFTRRMSPYERTRAQVYATGNRWQIENFEATH